MPERSKFDAIFESGAKSLRELAEKAPELVAQLRRMKERAPELLPSQVAETVWKAAAALETLEAELKTLARHPRGLGAWLETASPWLNRRFLGAASNILEPFLVGMGLRVESLGEDVIEVSMPGMWRNQGEGGAVHIGALSTLSEYATRLFWEHHLDLRHSELSARRVDLRLIAQPSGPMRAKYRITVGERESVLHRLRAEGHAEVEATARIYGADGRLVAEADVSWRLERQLALGPGI